MMYQVGGDPFSGERRQHPDVGHGGMAHDRPAGKRQPARHRVGGANELPSDESPDRAAGFEQLGNLPGRQVRQRGEPDHGGAKHVRRGDEIVLAVEHTDVGGHPAIMSQLTPKL